MMKLKTIIFVQYGTHTGPILWIHLTLIRPFPELREQSRQMTGLSFYLLIRSTSIIQMLSLPLYIGM